jgi:hypothetical protein
MDTVGKVGIGTTSPASILHAAGSTGIILGAASGNNWQTAAIKPIDEGGSYKGSLAFYTHPTAGSAGSPTERMRIDSSGNVEVKGGQELRVYRGDNATYGSIKYLTGSGGLQLNDKNGDGISFVQADGATEYMRIDSSGNLLVGTTTGNGANAEGFNFYNQGSGDSRLYIGHVNGTANGTQYVNFLYNSGIIGSISQNGVSAVLYNTSSDARLKDVTGKARGLEVINELNPVAYNWKADGKADEGLIAQEVKELVPNAVSGSEEEMYQMDYSKLVVHLVAGMKEQQTIIESLEARITALES